MEDNEENPRLEIKEQNKEIIRQVFELESNGHKDARDLYKEEIAGFLVKTDDGSYTLNSDKRNNDTETLHSKFGAKTESYEKFVKPSKLQEKAKTVDTVRVLDMCSGIGYNAAVLLEELKDSDVNIEIDMVESSIETLATALFIPDLIESHGVIKKVIEQYLIDNGYLKYNKILSNMPSKVSINIHISDARDFISQDRNKMYDAVFLDPFSPARSPELYTVDFFAEIKKYLSPTAVILTYTAASPVRSAFVEVGLCIGEGPKFHRSGGTIASLSESMIDVPLSFGDEKMIALGDVGIPFTDPTLKGNYNEIFEERQEKRIKARGVSKFPSSSKLPRYLGLSPEEIEDENLRNKLTAYVTDMGFNGLDDPDILRILAIDHNLSSRDQILALKDNLELILSQRELI